MSEPLKNVLKKSEAQEAFIAFVGRTYEPLARVLYRATWASKVITRNILIRSQVSQRVLSTKHQGDNTILPKPQLADQ